ncbi:MAG: FAD-dependent oxidoreductase, partial [Thermoanaerobaculia bacterium]|nr:FAD-dependent oxidoreductase [Thermoanaerobaculia bacterium]
MEHFDFIILGSGPAGQRAAIQAAKLGRTVAVIEKNTVIGGACVHTATIPSKTLREAVLYLSGWRQRGFYGRSYRVKERISASDLVQRLDITVRHEVEVLQHKLYRNMVRSIPGEARFLDPHRLAVLMYDGNGIELSADKILVATGTTPAQPPGIPFDGTHVFDSDQILGIKQLPRTLVVVGAGVIGVEYASIFSALDIEVTLVDSRPALLEFLDREIVDEFLHHLRDRGMNIRLGEKVHSIAPHEGGRVKVRLASGREVRAETVLVTAGRQGATATLGLEHAGIAA